MSWQAKLGLYEGIMIFRSQSNQVAISAIFVVNGFHAVPRNTIHRHYINWRLGEHIYVLFWNAQMIENGTSVSKTNNPCFR